MTEPQMYQATSEIFAQVNGGDIWMLVNKESNVIESAHSSRDVARAARNGDTNLKPIQFQAGETQIEIIKPAEEPAEVTLTASPDDSIQGVIEGAEAAGMHVMVIDENTDFSKLPNLSGEPQSEFAKDKETMPEDPQPTTKPIDPKKEKKPKPEVSHKSTVEKPTRLVHSIADMLADANPDVTRKEIIAACAEAGIAHYTILTQYQAWRSNRGS